MGTPRRIEVFPDAKYRENVLFDELMVVDAKDLKLEIESEDNILEIGRESIDHKMNKLNFNQKKNIS